MSTEANEICLRSVAAALERAGVTDCDDPGEAIDVIVDGFRMQIDHLERTKKLAEDLAQDRLTELSALAAQVEGMRSAANRYLDHDGSRGVFDALELSKARGELDKALTLTPPASLALHDAAVRLAMLREMKEAYSTAIHWEDVREWIDTRIRVEAGREGE